MKRAFLALALLPSIASAHDSAGGMRYDIYCCNGNNHTGDCQEIPFSSVKTTPSGFEVTLRPGDHRLVTREHVFTVPYGKERKATDGNFHACLFPTEDKLRCFYAPDMGM